MLEDTAELLAHLHGIRMKVHKAGSLVADQGQLGAGEVAGGKGDPDSRDELLLGLLPVEVAVDQLAYPAKLPLYPTHIIIRPFLLEV